MANKKKNKKTSKKVNDKSLKDKAIEIKGNEYVKVADRITYFNENYENGVIKTEVKIIDSNKFLVRAKVYPNICKSERYFTGSAIETKGEGYINKTSALENAETSAVGRALGMMGIGVIENLASADEVKNATNRSKNSKKTCPVCGKEHNGKYPKCYSCYMKEKKGKSANKTKKANSKSKKKTKKIVNEDKAPF